MLAIRLDEYLKGVGQRMTAGYMQVLKTLTDGEIMNKEELSIMSRIKRAELDHILLQLFALGLVDVTTRGKSKMCKITKLGKYYIELVG